MNSLIVKTSLVVYVILAGISILILWKNSEAPDALKNVGAVLASILPIVIFGFSYLSPDKSEKTIHVMILFDSQLNRIIIGNEPNAYSTAFRAATSDLNDVGLTKVTSQSELMGKSGLDLVQRILVTKLTTQFQFNWDYHFDKMVGPGFRQTVFTAGKSKEKTILSQSEIKETLKRNIYYQDDSIPVLWQFCMPPNGRLTESENDHNRKINISSKLYNIEIDITPQTNIVLQQGIPGILSLDSANQNRFYGAFYAVKISGTSSLISKYSEESKDYKRWFDNVFDVISELDWEKIEEQRSKHKDQ